MSKEGNTEELQRYWTETDNPHTFSENADGAFVRFSDVEEREARLQARIEELAQDRDDMTDTILGLRERIEELEGIVSGKTMYDAASVADARWREHIEGAIEVELERYKREIETSEMWPANDPNFDWEHVRVPHLRSAGDAISRVYALRSLLDSGEEQKASEPAIYEGYGRKWERVKGTSALREVGDTGPDWDQCVYHMIGGRVQRFLMAEREARPSPSPALEGREGQTASFTVSSERHEWPDANGPGDGGSASAATPNPVSDRDNEGGEDLAARAKSLADKYERLAAITEDEVVARMYLTKADALHHLLDAPSNLSQETDNDR